MSQLSDFQNNDRNEVYTDETIYQARSEVYYGLVVNLEKTTAFIIQYLFQLALIGSRILEKRKKHTHQE